MRQLRLGTLQVGTKVKTAVDDAGNEVVVRDKSGKEVLVPVFKGPLAPDTLRSLIAMVGAFYKSAEKRNGLQYKGGQTSIRNKVKDLKELAGPKNEREGRIPMSQLRTVWLSSDQLISPWWRDQLRLYLLTGLRRSLLVNMRFSDINFRGRYLSISPHAVGTKRRGAKTPKDAKPIILPLSRAACAILAARREFAPDKSGPVWFAPKPTRGRARKDALLSDPRAAWTNIEELLPAIESPGKNLHFTPQDVRRTFATIGTAAEDADLVGVAMLMLHSGAGLAQKTKVAPMTIRYMGRAGMGAHQRMREAAEAVADYIRKATLMTAEEASRLETPGLAKELEDAANDDSGTLDPELQALYEFPGEDAANDDGEAAA